ncbi:FadR/GntR family transcriptional regulator [Roseovarius sp.]|uniref:FadR/GntR family transcriptional regulator n=1 Tax=Roseovarius sp. TaxID=1486281 RepID=UPI003A980496
MIDKSVFQPVQTEPAYRLAARQMRQQILSGEIKVGDALPSELALADLLKVNRSTLREAIRLLEENGMVARKPGGKKLFVSVPRTEDLSDRMTGAMILQKISLSDLYRTMLVLEPAIAAEAAHHANETHLAQLAANIEASRVPDLEHAQLAQLDTEFHDLIVQASGNRAMLLCRQPFGGLFYPAFEAVIRRLNAGERLQAAHNAIFEAIRDRDPETAESWMRKHIQDFRRGYELANLDIEMPISNL